MRLTIKEIGTVNARVLNTRFCQLMQKGETLPANQITVAEARETLRIEEELHTRLLKQLGRDPYPPDRIEKEHPSNYMISLLKLRTESKPTEKTEGKFGFKITVTSSIGSVVARQNVKVDSRLEADAMASDLIKQLGLKRATYKIS